MSSTENDNQAAVVAALSDDGIDLMDQYALVECLRDAANELDSAKNDWEIGLALGGVISTLEMQYAYYAAASPR